MIHKIFISLDETNNPIYINCINDILTEKEVTIYDYIKQSSTSYTE